MSWDGFPEAERRSLRHWLIDQRPSPEAFEFWEEWVVCLTDMWDGLFDGGWENDPVVWYHYYHADNSADQRMAFENCDRFMAEARERGYEL